MLCILLLNILDIFILFSKSSTIKNSEIINFHIENKTNNFLHIAKNIEELLMDYSYILDETTSW